MKSILWFFSLSSVRSSSIIAGIGFTIMVLYIDQRVSIESGIVYLQLAATPDDFRAVVSAWGRGGVDFYLKTLWIDFCYAAVYTAMLISGMLYFIEKKYAMTYSSLTGHFRYTVFIPALAALCDWIENILHIILLQGGISPGLVLVSFTVSVLKWFFLLFSLVFFLFLYFGYRKSEGKR